jgi:F-type H+-transporting ATPase subunit delta
MAAGSESAARRYADAVFEIAQSEDRLDDWEEELEILAAAFSSAEALAWLSTPSVPAADKDRLIQTGLASASEEARNLARLLVTRGRAKLTGPILDAYRLRLNKVRGIAHALVTTAVALSDQDGAAIEARLSAMTGQAVKMEMAVDPSIIGGVVVRMGDKLIDGSTRARLLDLKRRLAGGGH